MAVTMTVHGRGTNTYYWSNEADRQLILSKMGSSGTVARGILAGATQEMRARRIGVVRRVRI